MATSPSLSAVSGSVARLSDKVDTLEGQGQDIKLQVGLLAHEVKANRERAEERHATLLDRFDRLDEHSKPGALEPKPKLFGLSPGTGREIAVVVGAFAVIAASYFGGQSGSTASTAEVVEQVEAAVEVIEERIPPPPAPKPAPVVPHVDAWTGDEPADTDTDTDTDVPPTAAPDPRPSLLPLRRQ